MSLEKTTNIVAYCLNFMQSVFAGAMQKIWIKIAEALSDVKRNWTNMKILVV